jgi:hypothetical protein
MLARFDAKAGRQNSYIAVEIFYESTALYASWLYASGIVNEECPRAQ